MILRQKIIFVPIAEGGAKIVGVFRVKNHDFTPKNHIFSNFRGGGAPGPPPSGSAPAKERHHKKGKLTIGKDKSSYFEKGIRRSPN